MPPPECAGSGLFEVISVWEFNNSGCGPLFAAGADCIGNEVSEAREALVLCMNAPSPFGYSGLEGAVKVVVVVVEGNSHEESGRQVMGGSPPPN